MLRKICVMCIWLVSISTFGQSTEKYQVGTITSVKPHQTQTESGAATYEVSVKVGDTVYVVLYSPPFSASPVKYAAGRNLLVQVGEKTVRYNDILGQSFEVPIISQTTASGTAQVR
jgi:co-chaperonin GroES (HSP10)